VAKRKEQIKINYESLSQELKNKYEEFRIKFNGENIYALREEAKKMLIASPTTYSKQELIEQMLNKIIAYYLSADNNERNNRDIDLKLMDDYRNSLYIEGEELEGYLKLNDNGGEVFLFERYSHYVYVPQGIINEFFLKEGDFIKVKVKDIDFGKKGVFDVIYIGGREEPKQKPIRFEESTPIDKTAKIVFLEKEIKKGGRIIGENLSVNKIAEIKADAERQGLQVLIALLDELPENVTSITSTLSGIYLYDMCDSEIQSQMKTASFMLEIAKRKVERGEDVLLMVRNLDILPLDMARKVFGSARSFEKGSLTIIAETFNERFQKIATSTI